MNLRYAASLVPCIFGELHLWWAASLMWCIHALAGWIFGVIHLWWAAYIMQCIYGVLIRWSVQLCWIISWLQYFFCVLYLRCVASLVLCICTFGMLCIGIFGGASLVRLLLCNASLEHCFWSREQYIFGVASLGSMHCQLYRAGLLPQWRIYFLI